MKDAKEKIKIHSFSKQFGDLLVLDDLNINVYEGEFLCIVGPTGCGKTTLAKLIVGLISPTKGNVLIDDQLANPRRQSMSFVFQEPSCFPWRTVRENIQFALKIKGVARKESERRAAEILSLVGLAGFENYLPSQISSGMKQRVAIARAFVTHPDLLLMDEPFGQLDEEARFHLEDELIELWQKLKQTVIFVTHNLEEAVYLAERIIVLTQKPTHVKAEVLVDLPRPRDYTHPRFIEIRKQLTDLVKWW